MTKWAVLAVVFWASTALAGEYYFEPGQGQVGGSTCAHQFRGTGSEPRTLVIECPDAATPNIIDYSFSYPESVGSLWNHVWNGTLAFEATQSGRLCFIASLWVIDETGQKLDGFSPTNIVSGFQRVVSPGEVGQTLTVSFTILTTLGQNTIPVGCTTGDCRRRRSILRIGRGASSSCLPGPSNTGAIDFQGVRLRFD